MFPQDFTFTVAYLGNIGRHLWDNVDVNAPIPGPGAFNPRRPYFSKFGWTTGQTQRNNQLSGYPELKSNYNSLQATVQKRFGSGFNLLSNFTWAKSLDEGTFGPQNIFDFASNYGNSDSVRPFSWVTAAVWNLPFGRGKAFAGDLNRAAEALIGGWTLSGIYNFEGGFYFTPTLANNASLNSTIGSKTKSHWEWASVPIRIDTCGSTQQPLQCLRCTSMAIRAAISYWAHASPPPIYRCKRLLHSLRRVHLDLKWDAFNAFNHTNLANPNSSVDTSTAGQITGIVDFKRRMQIGAQLTF